MKKILLLILIAYSTAIFAQHKPTTGNHTEHLNEDVVLTFESSMFPCYDTESDPLTSVIIVTTTTDSDLLKLNGVNVSPGQTIDVADINAGKLKFTPPVNESGDFTFTFRVDDGHDGISDNIGTMTVRVHAVNDAPSFAILGNQTVDEDCGAKTIAGFAHTIKNGGADESGQTLTFNISATNISLFSSSPTISSAGTLSYTPAPNQHGSSTVTVTLSDNGSPAGISSAETFTITVNSINDVPTSADNSITVDENATYKFSASDFPFSDADAGDNLHSVRFSLTPAGLFWLDADNNGVHNTGETKIYNGTVVSQANLAQLSFRSVPDDNTNQIFKFTVSDGTASSSPANTTTININPVNSNPFFKRAYGSSEITINEDAGPQTISGWATDIRAGGPDETGQSLHFDIVVDNPNLFSVQPTMSLAGDLSYTVKPNASGSSAIHISLYDEETPPLKYPLSSGMYFLIKVHSVNDEPTSADKTVTINENQVFTFNLGHFEFHDVDMGNQLHHITCANVPPKGVLWVDANNNGVVDGSETALSAGSDVPKANVSKLKYKPEDNNNDNQSFNFTVSDGTASSNPPNTMTIDIIPVNSVPYFTVGANQVVDENCGVVTVSAWATGISAGGPDEESTQTLTFNVNSDNPTLFSVQPTIASDGTLSYTPAQHAHGTSTVTVSLSDNGSPAEISANQTFTITVNEINEAPSFTAGGDQKVYGVETDTEFSVPWATNITAGAGEETSQNVDFVVTNDDNSLFVTQPSISPTGVLTYKVKAHKSGTAEVTVYLKDNGSPAPEQTAPVTFYINIVKVYFLVPTDGINDAITAAIPHSRIQLANGTYNQNIDFQGKNVEVVGNSADPNLVKIQGTGTGSVVVFNNGETASTLLSSLTISGGIGTLANPGVYAPQARYGGGIYCNGASPTLSNLIIRDNEVQAEGLTGASGGGIYLKNSNSVLNNVEVLTNKALIYRGGGIAIDNSTIELNNVSITGNETGNYGGGLFAATSHLIMNNVTITGNKALHVNGAGGGLFLIKCTHNITNLTINSNTSTRSGANITTFKTPNLGSYSSYEELP